MINSTKPTFSMCEHVKQVNGKHHPIAKFIRRIRVNRIQCAKMSDIEAWKSQNEFVCTFRIFNSSVRLVRLNDNRMQTARGDREKEISQPHGI